MDTYREVRPLRAILFYSVYGLAALLSVHFSARITAAQTPRQDALIQTLFGELPPDNALDANGDGALTVADILLLGPESQFTPTPTPTSTPTPTPTETAIPTETFTPTPSPTQIGTLFVGTIAELVPHGVGDQLVYRVTDPIGRVTTETTMVLSLEADGTFVLDDKTVNGAQVLNHQTQNYLDTGSQLLVNGGSDLVNGVKTTCTPQLLQLMVPVIAGEMFSTTSHCDVRFISTGTVVGFIDRIDTFTPIDVVDSVSVPAGTYTNVLHFTGSINLSGDVEADEIYIAPGVGIVQRLQTSSGKTTKKELTRGTIGGQPVER